MHNESLGEIAYQAYGDTTNHLNYQGLPMPTWENLTPTIRQAWENSALKIYHLSNPPLVSEQYAWRDKLDTRQQKIVFNAEEYNKDPFGDIAHNLKVVIAILAEELDLRAKVK